MGVMLVAGLPTLYSAPSGDPKITVFRAEPGARFLDDILLADSGGTPWSCFLPTSAKAEDLCRFKSEPGAAESSSATGESEPPGGSCFRFFESGVFDLDRVFFAGDARLPDGVEALDRVFFAGDATRLPDGVDVLDRVLFAGEATRLPDGVDVLDRVFRAGESTRPDPTECLFFCRAAGEPSVSVGTTALSRAGESSIKFFFFCCDMRRGEPLSRVGVVEERFEMDEGAEGLKEMESGTAFSRFDYASFMLFDT
jgi:hypothetical protein